MGSERDDEWTIREVPVYGDLPYNGRIIGWRIDLSKGESRVSVHAPFLSKAREKMEDEIRRIEGLRGPGMRVQ